MPKVSSSKTRRPLCAEGWQDRLTQAYGTHADLVRLMPAATIAAIPENTYGWWSQQALKLTAAKIVTARLYLVLDAKNHFIFQLTAEHVETNGKPRMFTKSYATHSLRRYLRHILTYFGLSQEHVGCMLPTAPPFYIDTALAREMIEAMAQREGPQLRGGVLLISLIKFTEFLTLAAYLLSKGHRFEDYYDLGGHSYSIIWGWMASDGAVIAKEIAKSESGELPIFSVHRRAFPLLTEASRHALAGLWQRRGLFDSEAEALHYLADPNGCRPSRTSQTAGERSRGLSDALTLVRMRSTSRNQTRRLRGQKSRLSSSAWFSHRR